MLLALRLLDMTAPGYKMGDSTGDPNGASTVIVASQNDNRVAITESANTVTISKLE